MLFLSLVLSFLFSFSSMFALLSLRHLQARSSPPGIAAPGRRRCKYKDSYDDPHSMKKKILHWNISSGFTGEIRLILITRSERKIRQLADRSSKAAHCGLFFPPVIISD